MKVKKLVAVLMIIVMLLCFTPANVLANTTFKVTVHFTDTGLPHGDFYKEYTITASDEAINTLHGMNSPQLFAALQGAGGQSISPYILIEIFGSRLNISDTVGGVSFDSNGNVSITIKKSLTPYYCTVTFDSGANGSIKAGDKSYFNVLKNTTWANANITVPEIVPNTGYAFISWSPAIPAGSYVINTNLLFTAQYNGINTITFNTDGNGTLSGDTSYSNIPDGTVWSNVITVPTPNANIGYQFNGWMPTLPDANSLINNSATYTATFVASNYTITYNLDGGTNSGNNLAAYKEANTPITLYDATKLGYTFGGWYDNAGLSGTAVTTIAEGTTGNLEFWAKWSQDTYAITYNLDGGTNSGNNLAAYKEADTPITLYDATKLGYTFGGWYDNSALSGSPITTVAEGTTGNLTYWAKWTQDTYSITYNNILATDTNTNPASYVEEDTAFALVNAARLGYTFGGWYDNAGLSGTAVTTVAKGTAGNLTFWAKWVKDASLWHDVTFTTNGHGTLSGTTSFNDILDGTIWNTVITVPAPTPNAGYKLGSWSPNLPNGTSQIKSNLTFTYNFKVVKYDIHYVINGGINDWRNPYKYTIEDTVNFHDPYRLGYTFQGWYTTSDFTSLPVSGMPQGSTGDITLYAKWEKDSFYWNDVNFTTDGHGTLIGTTSYTDIFLGTPWFLAINSVPAPVANTGYEFNTWSPVIPKWYSLILTDATYMADFVPIDYNISYVLNGGINNATNPTSYNIESSTINLQEPSFYGYTFGGWYDNAGLGGTAITSIPAGSTGDKTFYAKWEKDTSLWNDVTFTTDGHGTLSGTASFTDILEGTIWNSVITVPTPVANTGYEFNAWNPILPATNSAINDDATYTATFNAIDYDINYMLNGGVNNAANPTSYNIESSTISLLNPTKLGYTFGGWYDNAGLSGTAITSIPAGSTGDKTFYAKWQKDASLWYDINFTTDGNGTLAGTTSFKDILSGTVWNTVVTAPMATPNAGYAFNAWTPVLPATTSAITKDVTYRANFRAIVYGITYALDGGTNSEDNPATYTVERAAIIFADPTKDGYTFDGWYTTADFTGDKVTRIAAGSTGNRTLYAKWTANTIIDDNPTPLAPGEPVLTLINLLCAILTLLGMIYMFASNKGNEDIAGRRRTTRITGVILAAAAIILFFITQPLVWNFRWVDKWTVLFIIITLVQATAIYIKNKATKAEATQE